MPAALMPPTPTRHVTWLDLLAVAVVTAAVFVPVLHTGFAPLDDSLMISANPKVIKPSWDAFVGFWAAPAFRIYMPLALSVWQFLAIVFHSQVGTDGSLVVTPLAYKVVSVATHALAAAAVAWTVSTLTRTRWPAIVGALVFALHPVQVESVAWTTGLKDELCGLFSFLAIGFYARHAGKNPVSALRDGWWWGAFAAALLAMASKSTASVLPAVLIVVDFTVRRCAVVRRFLSVGPVLLPALGCTMIIVGAQGGSLGSAVRPILRPLVAGDTYAFYLRKIVWPGQLSIDYGRRPNVIEATRAIWWTWLVPAAALVGVLAMRSWHWLLAAALFAVPILPVSGLATFDMQQFSTVTDHYLYQPMAGVALAVALLAAWRPAAGTVVAALTVVLAVMTYHEAKRWQDVGRQYRRILDVNPRSWMARDIMGVISLSRGDLFTARRIAAESLAVNPESGGTLDNLSQLAVQRGHDREAAELCVRATDRLVPRRLGTARRLTLLGARLKDLELTEKGLRYWRLVEPDNLNVVDMLMNVMDSKRRERAGGVTRPGAPTTQ